jgi:hypothetical protein
MLGLMAVSLGLVGALLGLGQWFVLRRYLPRIEWWVIASFLGYAVGYSLVLVPIPAVDEFGPAKLVLGLGSTLGILQWLTLRGRVPQAGWWIIISLAGWALAIALPGVLYLTGLYVEPFDLVAALLMPAAVTGAGMVWLLQAHTGG